MACSGSRRPGISMLMRSTPTLSKVSSLTPIPPRRSWSTCSSSAWTSAVIFGYCSLGCSSTSARKPPCKSSPRCTFCCSGEKLYQQSTLSPTMIASLIGCFQRNQNIVRVGPLWMRADYVSGPNYGRPQKVDRDRARRLFALSRPAALQGGPSIEIDDVGAS